MTSKEKIEALKKICNNCEKEMGKRKVACPFRSISNEYCEEYETIKKSLKALEIIKERFVWLENGELYCGRINDIQTPIDEEIEGKEEMELLKEVLCKD